MLIRYLGFLTIKVEPRDMFTSSCHVRCVAPVRLTLSPWLPHSFLNYYVFRKLLTNQLGGSVAPHNYYKFH